MENNEFVAVFMQIVRKIENLDLFAASAKFSKTEFRILREIVMENEKGNEIIASELSRRIGVTRSAISQIVNKMEKDGTVKRVPAPNDKKIAYVRLSERTLAIYEEQCKQADECLSKMVSIYGKDKMDAFIGSCKEIIAIYETVKKELSENRK